MRKPRPRNKARGPVRTPKEVRRAFFEFLKPIASAIQQTLGSSCEVVLHDFSDPAHSIVWIQGNVTGRKVGGSVSALGLEMISGGDSQPDKIALIRNTQMNRVIKDTTVLLRDFRGHVFGCLCINLDITDMVAAWEGLGELVGRSNEVRELPFSDQIGEVLKGMIKSTQDTIGVPPAAMKREDHRRFIGDLEVKGAFSVQRSVPTIASYLGVSRPTIYKYLNEIRSRSPISRDAEGGFSPLPESTPPPLQP